MGKTRANYKTPDSILINAKELKTWSFRLKALYPLFYTLLFLVSPVLLALLGLGKIAIMLLLLLAINWLYRSIQTLYGLTLGYILYKRSTKINWFEKLNSCIRNWNKLPNPEELPESWDDFIFAIIIPVYKEPYDLLVRTFTAIKNSKYDLTKVHVIIALEERAGINALKRAKRIKQEFKEYFKIHIYVHPPNISGEVIGIAGPNLTWAAKQFYGYLKKHKIAPKNVFMLKYDCDTKIHPQFLANITYRYLSDKYRMQKFYTTAVILYANNIWRVPSFSRVYWILFSFVVLGSWQVLKERAMSFSIYGFNFNTLKNIGFWDTVVGIDDTEFFIQAFMHYNTEFQGEAIYTPVYMDAVEGEHPLKTAQNLFKQQLRWGAGAILAPITLTYLWKNKKITLYKKLYWTLRFIEVYSLIPTASYLLLLGMPIILLINNYITYFLAGHMIPRFLSISLKLSMLTALIILYLILKMYRRAKQDKLKFTVRFIITYIEFYLVVVNSIIFSLLPYTISQFKIFLGKYRNFYVADKKA